MMNQEFVESKNLKAKIYTIRGLTVMLDRDLAALYHGTVAKRLFCPSAVLSSFSSPHLSHINSGLLDWEWPCS